VAVGEEIRGDLFLERGKYGKEDKFQQDKEVKLIKTLTADRDLSSYFLPNPYYLSESAFYVKNSKNLSQLTAFFDKSLSFRVHIYTQLMALYGKLRPFGVFPILEIIHVTSDYRLIIVPNGGFHTESIRFLRECLELFDVNDSKEREKQDFEYFVTFASFTDLKMVQIGAFSKILRAEIGSEAYFLHPISDMSRDFSVLLAAYRSRISTLKDQENTLIGWTEGGKSINTADLYEESDESLFYICERAKLEVWTCRQPLQDSYELLLLLEEFHKTGNFHLFISFATIRKDPQTHHLAIVLPCVDLVFAELLGSFLGEQWADFQAPEVRDYLAYRTPISSPQSADIYSICRTIQVAIGDLRETGTDSLRIILQKGVAASPQDRPPLVDIKDALLKVLSLQLTGNTCRQSITVHSSFDTMSTASRDIDAS
jgi:hypothetical protein